jgi:hypothetical protein
MVLVNALHDYRSTARQEHSHIHAKFRAQDTRARRNQVLNWQRRLTGPTASSRKISISVSLTKSKGAGWNVVTDRPVPPSIRADANTKPGYLYAISRLPIPGLWRFALWQVNSGCPVRGPSIGVSPVRPRASWLLAQRQGDYELLPGCGIPGHLVLLSVSFQSRSPGYFQVALSHVMTDVSFVARRSSVISRLRNRKSRCPRSSVRSIQVCAA